MVILSRLGSEVGGGEEKNFGDFGVKSLVVCQTILFSWCLAKYFRFLAITIAWVSVQAKLGNPVHEFRG